MQTQMYVNDKIYGDFMKLILQLHSKNYDNRLLYRHFQEYGWIYNWVVVYENKTYSGNYKKGNYKEIYFTDHLEELIEKNKKEIYKLMYKDKLFNKNSALFNMMENIINKQKQEEPEMQKEECYIIAGVDKATGKSSISAFPVIHTSLSIAKKEAERLAKSNTDKSFTVLKIEGTCSVSDVNWV